MCTHQPLYTTCRSASEPNPSSSCNVAPATCLISQVSKTSVCGKKKEKVERTADICAAPTIRIRPDKVKENSGKSVQEMLRPHTTVQPGNE
ncbi:hypothetical protein NPIL_579541 [Nephila pilipes]|uniref:Uncharacterized protein n=1 Tax=Nephila pilipes TaxID=299642 RepID=A0A8X6NU46_NEPPI|nr:hypothetical protein NPIL_579541 [Nephila pilipes]